MQHGNFEILNDRSFITIINTTRTGSHCIILTNMNCAKNCIKIYDLLTFTYKDKDDWFRKCDNVKPVLEALMMSMGTRSLTVNYLGLQHQMDGNICGLFAMIYVAPYLG